ncbi:hypothetical protein CDL15_Pgr015867 [Punica granatum]|uniref:MATH domain-containing protein n=1 Tax=Punica granatum TaxID=22663 RepID=A0A218XQN4_PUNGR|nr:hypothetical protein CDL15_Pgr015867 [Punica granatum]
MEEEEQLPSGKYTWMIDSFSEKKNKPKFSSNAFTVGGCKWQITMYLRLEAHYLEISLEFADTAALPDGWCRDANFAFTLTDHDCKITLHVVVPSVELATQVSTLGTYFSSFSDHFTTAGTPYLEEGSSSDRQTIDLASDAPSLDDIEKAKHSVKECLSDLFKLNMRDRLSSALSILSHARAGLSTDQKRSIETFKANFDDFVCDFLNFEQDNSDFELQKITRDHMYSAMKRNHETHLSHQHLFNSITKEKEELNKRLKELSFRETMLVYDWETLMNESEEVKSRYAIQGKKLAQAEEKKKIAEERMSRSTSAWSCLKEQFL